MATKLNALVDQLPQQQEQLVDETVTMEMSPTQLESSVNMFDDMVLQQLDDQSGNQDDHCCSHDQEHNQNNDKDQQHIDETVVMEISTQLESSNNIFDEAALQQLDDHISDQDDQHCQDPGTLTTQEENDQNADQDNVTSTAYEVQGVSVTFDSDSEDDDIVTMQVEEDINETWLYSDSHPTQSVSVTIATTDRTSKHAPNCVSVTPLM